MTTNKDYYGGKTSWFVFKAYEYEQKYKQNKTGACFDSVITWLFEEFNPLIRAKQIIEEADLSASCKVNEIKRAISGSYRGAPSEGTNVAVYTTKTEMLKAFNKLFSKKLATSKHVTDWLNEQAPIDDGCCIDKLNERVEDLQNQINVKRRLVREAETEIKTLKQKETK